MISLIVCTRNRAAQLRNCLSSMLSLVAPCEWELVIVDNGSTDATRTVVEDFAASVPFRVRYAQEPVAGLSRARNRGIATAAGDIILFTDDDCYPEPGYLQAAAQVLSQPRVDYFGGRVLLHDASDAAFTIKTSAEVEPIPARSFVPAGMVHGANLGFRRRVVDTIGGFNEGLGAGSSVNSGEDVEYVARASAAGFSGGYFPGPAVRHHHGRKPYDVRALAWGYHVGRGAYYTAMLLHSDNKGRYLAGWLAASSWKRPRKAAGELWGGLRYAQTCLAALAARRTLIPHPGPAA